METFDSARKALGDLRPSQMMKLMRECGLEADINAEITDEQFDMLYEANKNLNATKPTEPEISEGPDDTENIDDVEETSGEDDEAPENEDDGAEESMNADEVEEAEDEEPISDGEDESEDTYKDLTDDDSELATPAEDSEQVNAENLKKEMDEASKDENLTDKDIAERFAKCLEFCGFESPDDGMFDGEQAKDIRQAHYILYGKKIKPVGPRKDDRDFKPGEPLRPLVSDTVPREDYLEAEADPKQGSIVYRDDKEKTPYLLFESVKEGQGTEGTVYIVRNKSENPPARENLVAKIYDPPYRTKRRESKIRAMINRKLHHNSICFPTAVLTDNNGVFVGFLMMKADGVKLTSLLEMLRKREKGKFFSDWTRKDIVRLIIKTLDAFKFLHSNNILLGDVCLDNVMVTPRGEIYIVDTDSCQILPKDYSLSNLSDPAYLRPKDFRVTGYPCPGERVKYNSPEFQEALREYDASEIFRTEGDELFALAVLLFEFVMIGQWPYTRSGAGDQVKAKKDGIFSYPKYHITKKIVHDNRTSPVMATDNKGKQYVQTATRGLVNLPPESLKIWDHLPSNIKRAFRETFAKRGSRRAENSRITADEWLGMFLSYNKNDKWWSSIECDELFPKLFYKPKCKQDEKGAPIEIPYIECRFCHDLVDKSECLGKFHDECPLCWEEGTVQRCAKCKTEFLITREEAERARKTGKQLRNKCDDCMEYTHQCSEGHEFRVSHRIEEELYARYGATLWAGQKVKERDYSMYCPVCVDVVMCEICREPIRLTKRVRCRMEMEGRPFSSVCEHCRPVEVTCEECGETFEIKKHVHDEMKASGQPFSSICPHNPSVEAECERCMHKFQTRKHIFDRLNPEGKMYTQCPMGEKVKVSCEKCSTSGRFIQHEIERYWAEDMKRRGESYDCGNHKSLFGLLGSSGSVEPSINHREKP